ncbi:nuclear receptor coactivator 7 isoform X1 [Heterocephalus glaber]|uniref:Nuclear receptor coactivator 7 isoform X1 n=2 Tax=Heterocephalus glaber TaxID=10181 RepID=A0AAX6SYH0_HETGA|nr:nuclear receptor coactivator 7 isoform X1 [Heterocephalus glaber]XP_004845996.1 nuclear receptor coactivator 7 isoform X1 [Heterocephalus glaber]XP_004845998.1 nuclear receptor coactivator 7 isoform X1 [Heterocephalus glaber]XP_021114855.1 nuclear receptor coactivator 7 isoform X1 [Heterocephalus glaber]XP_021114856.1 nuclear receptor coactivator 7 isoform X1 [Heterocephalus glaber]XP_021114858.1 nuclear receptor coactivator 7 isoform X1 [Heterocephalus glaber]
MDTKEEKKERKQSYFARLKKKKQAKQNAETPTSIATRPPLGKDDANSVILEQDKCSIAVEEEYITDEKKKRKNNQLKEIRRTELKRYYSVDDNQNKTHDKKEKKMVVQKPHGTMEYTAGSQDTLNSIALKFNITPNKLVELNKLFTHTIVPGQVLFVPDASSPSGSLRLSSSSPGATVSPSSSDAEYDKLPDADLARKALKPIERVLSSTSEEDEPGVVKFLKMNCRYFTDGKGVVGGVMIVTPNNIMFDPHKSDPLVIENGCEEYGLICPMEEVVSIALYNDISHMKIKDALPSDLPRDLCPLYRPGEWEDLASERDLSPFSKFKSISKERRQQSGARTGASGPPRAGSAEGAPQHPDSSGGPGPGRRGELRPGGEPFPAGSEPGGEAAGPRPHFESAAREKCLEGEDDDFVDLEELSSQAESGVGKSDAAKERPSVGSQEPRTDSSAAEVQARSVLSAQARERAARLQGTLASEACEERAAAPEAEVDPQLGCAEGRPAHSPSVLEDLDKMKLIEFYLAQSEEGPREAENTLEAEWSDPAGIDITLSSALPRAGNTPTESTPEPGEAPEEETEPLALQGDPDAEEKSIEGPLVSPVEPTLDDSRPGVQMNSKSEIQLWLLKRIQVPIEDILPSKEEKSKTPPMFLCIRVGKPMRKSFATHTAAMVQQYGRRRKQPEYWFAVPRERVDHLYTFFVQWSPDVYGKDAKEQGFVVVEKEELNMIDNFFSEPTAKSWEIITVEEAKRRRSTCSYYEDEDDGGLPVLQPHSALLENMHIEQLARRLPARVQGYPWRLAYSTLEHGTSLKTLYRKSASLDSPVLLVIKDMDNQIFGAYATHPFKFSDHYYGTGETFLYTFSPNFKVFKWSGENSYFINGDISSLELGGGGGRFGLWLDADLYHGRSNSCSTFNNDILSKKEDFIVQDLEVWTFE